jgi:hypothetical protein
MAQRSEADTDQAAGTGRDQLPDAEAASLANALVSGTSATTLEQYVEQLVQPQATSATTQAAHVLEALAQIKPELLAPYIELLVKHLDSPHIPVAQCCAHCLPALARVTPAKVAKQLKAMQAALPNAPAIAKDGLVRTFVALCVASVTYQKRLIDNFELALRTAQPEQLPSWAEHILPALKGEPYAQARSVVENRLPDPQIPREIAQRVADFLGVKLRPLPDRK